MKKFKHKKINATAELCSDEYWYLIKYFDENENEINRFSIPKSLIENTNDWEEITEPQEKVIEGYVFKEDTDENHPTKNLTFYFNLEEGEKSADDIPARLILNPKKKRKYVRWVSKTSLEHIEGCYGDVILRLDCDITTKREHKITITVEDSE